MMTVYWVKAYVGPAGVERYHDLCGWTIDEIFRRGPPCARYSVVTDEANYVIVVDLTKVPFYVLTKVSGVDKEAFDYSYQDIDQAIMATALTYTHSSLLDRRERWQAKSLRHAEMYSTDQPINLKRWLSQIRDH